MSRSGPFALCFPPLAAARKVCSSDVRKRLKVFGWESCEDEGSGTLGPAPGEEEGCTERAAVDIVQCRGGVQVTYMGHANGT